MKTQKPTLFIDEGGLFFQHQIGGKVYVLGFDGSIFSGHDFYGTK